MYTIVDEPKRTDLEYDANNSAEEDRYNITGNSGGKWLVVTVTLTPRDGLVRIISARKADSLEERAYHASVRKITGN